MSDASELSKTYAPSEIEHAIYASWLESGAFHARPDDRPRDRRYVVMMPLPNVTGALHMGHAMDNVMQDLLIRWHRMRGDNTLWMPGTDHAGIATQAVVEKRLKELEGKTRHDLGREGLVQRIWQWKDQYQARIIAQQQRMGCSCDWQRQRFTMDAVCARAVRHTFFRMFVDALIFRGQRLVNWDPFLRTSISDYEIYHEAVQGHFWHLRYPIIDPRPGEPGFVVVATTRPETMLGDTAVAVHPDPEAALAATIAAREEALGRAPEKERAALQAELAALGERRDAVLPSLVRLRDMARDGRQVNLPLLDRRIPLILDAWAKPELGSGCVKITPAHDFNDYDVWTRHRQRIEIINILAPDGTLNDSAGPYRGLDRFVAREAVVADLERAGLVEKIEDRPLELGHSDRSKTPVEPYLSDQWFVAMGDVQGGVVMGRATPKEHRAPGLVQAAMDAVLDGRVRVHPERYAKTYLDWLAEKRDWPISRQLWWGHRIPVWSRADARGELDLTALGAPLPGRAVRLQRLDDGTSRLVEDPRTFADAVAPDVPCRVDVCLLEDDPARIAALERLGYARDPDVLDTWFSSALWPFSTLGWPDPASAPLDGRQATLGAVDGHADCLDTYYPGSCLVTARDIITLWVARMVLAGLYNLGDVPFSDVFIHANILDGKGERMSKSKGNGIDPVDIIEAYGTDAMRYVLCDMQTGTQDIRLPVTAICPSCGHRNDLATTEHGRSIFTYVCGQSGAKGKEGCGTEIDVLGTLPELPSAKLISERFDVGRAFCTKLWNSARFAFMNLQDVPSTPRRLEALALEDRWILGELSLAIRALHAGLSDYNPSAALGAAREFFWSALCDWYLELIKPRLQEGDDSAPVARQVLALCLDQVLRLLHPFVPFITEHLWQRLGAQVPERGLGPLAPAAGAPLLINAPWPQPLPALEDAPLRATFADLQAMTRAVREVRTGLGLPPRQPLRITLKVPAARAEGLRAQAHVMVRLAGVGELAIDPEARRTPGAASKVIGDLQILVHDVIDDAVERERLHKALDRVDKEVAGCEKRLADPKFAERAPAEVVAEHRERLAGYVANRQVLIASLHELDPSQSTKAE
jgi:valyl-tRNA synthetase